MTNHCSPETSEPTPFRIETLKRAFAFIERNEVKFGDKVAHTDAGELVRDLVLLLGNGVAQTIAPSRKAIVDILRSRVHAFSPAEDVAPHIINAEEVASLILAALTPVSSTHQRPNISNGDPDSADMTGATFVGELGRKS